MTDPLPSGGGSYVRQPDGALIRAEHAPANAADIPPETAPEARPSKGASKARSKPLKET
ncbi:MAG: hypothetical protein WBA67_06315 [Jannaschia sp.]